MSTKMAPIEPQCETGSNVSEGAVRAAVDRMLSHPEFGATPRRREFLKFIVEEALAGRGPALKGFTIAQAVFGRDDSFDPKSDPVVRLEARRLRQDLDSYYVGPGVSDPIRISIPKGRYAPWFEVTTPATTPTPASSSAEEAFPTPNAKTRGTGRKRTSFIGGLLLLALALIAGTWLWFDLARKPAEADYPRVAILPFEAMDSTTTTRTLSMGLTAELVLKLRSFDSLRLFTPLAADDLKSTLAAFGDDMVPTYVIRGTVQTERDDVLVNVQLLYSNTGEVIWADAYHLSLDPTALGTLRETISTEIATALGQPYGPLNDDVQLRAVRSQPKNLESYLCVLQAYTYRRTFSREAFAPVQTCLEAAVARSPDYADAWAMLGWMKLDAVRHGFVPRDQADEGYAAALEAAERAYRLAPDNIQAVKALAGIHHYIGNFSEGERFGRMALDLNPNDPDTLAQVGWRLSVRGNYEEGGPLMEQAIQRTIDPPGWYYHLPSLQNFMLGDYEKALSEAEIAVSKGSGFGQFLVAINAMAIGDEAMATKALEALTKAPRVGKDPAGFMRHHGATEEIISKSMEKYREAQSLVLGQDGAKPATQD